MKNIVFLLVLLAFAVPAAAQEITITALCGQLAPHKSEGVEGADYKPGVDVNGKPVAPADFKSEIKPIIYPIEIPIEIDILRLLDIDLSDATAEAGQMEAGIAHLKVFEDGRVEYNGQDISEQVSYACKDGQPPEDDDMEPVQAPQPPKAAGQAPAQAVASEHATKDDKKTDE